MEAVVIRFQPVAGLHRFRDVVGSLLRKGLERRPVGQPVERIVGLHGLKPPGVEAEPVVPAPLAGAKGASPVGVVPSRRADQRSYGPSFPAAHPDYLRPAPFTISHGPVSSACSTPSLAVTNATEFPVSSPAIAQGPPRADSSSDLDILERPWMWRFLASA